MDPQAFSNATRMIDGWIITMMDTVISAGISEARVQIAVALGLVVLGVAVLTLRAEASASLFISTAIRAVCVSAILQMSTYNYFVRDLFFTDLPNRMAAAVGGPQTSSASADQFGALMSATLHAQSYVLAQATGFLGAADRAVSHIQVFLIGLALWIIWTLWTLTRVFLAIVIMLGPFVILLFLFRATRGFVEQWIGKLVGMMVLQLATSIVLRLMLLLLTERLRVMQAIAPTGNLDQMHANMGSFAQVCWAAVIIMVTLPGAVAIGSGGGASAAYSAAGHLRNVASNPLRALRR